MNRYNDTIESFTSGLKSPFSLKAVFFDMDGVLFDSMPLHVDAWCKAFKTIDLQLPEIEAYLNEGSPAVYTVSKMVNKYLHRSSTEEEIVKLKNTKHRIMKDLPNPKPMVGMLGFLKKLKALGIDIWVVTGSAQRKMFNLLESNYPGLIHEEKMVTAFDVKIGKPDPEPYLKALEKSGYSHSEAIVVENAPLGVESSTKAGIFTIAINTGPLEKSTLSKANIVLDGSLELISKFDGIMEALNQTIDPL